jgi:tetratricopeptide (TPR) repeat protein/transglutaminase-like putative cysteine protease
MPLPFSATRGKNIALMLRYLSFALFVVGLVGRSVDLGAQQIPAATEPKAVPAATAPKPDYSNEAFIDEQDTTTISFENDGTSTRETSARIRIQSDAGVQRYSVLTFSYQNATETIDIDYVRVLKPDGTAVRTPADNIQEMPSEITRQAPLYSDLREKHVAVKGLSVGDVLEMKSHWRSTKPLALGQFWYAYNFSHDSIMLHEELRVTVPRDRAIKWKSERYKPVINEEGSRRTYTWTSSQLESKSPVEQKKQQEEQAYALARGRLPSPDVQISSFQTWEEIGTWYNHLQLERVKPTDEIRRKAFELTKDAKDDDAKVRAIYKYVATQFRYIGVAFGIGRYQPHSAGEILSNQYGDCKDKHTLLASLLDAVGIKAYPALINSSLSLDPDVPSPSQFNHVITAVPQGNGYIWLDTTAEVAPYGYLLSALWDKPALIVPNEKAALFVNTPAEPSSRATQIFRIVAKLKDDGTLDGKVERTISGDDSEVVLRNAFRRTPMPQWNNLVQQISYASGFSGEVSDVSVSPPEQTDEPFRISYSYSRKNYGDWSNAHTSPPLPPVLLPFNENEDKPTTPILLGTIGEAQLHARLELPAGYAVILPMNLHLQREFAEYQSSYTFTGNIFTADRRFVVKLREVPVNQLGEYKDFNKSVQDDHDNFIPVAKVQVPAQAAALLPTISAIRSLPNSTNPEAIAAEDEGRDKLQKGDVKGAISDLQHAVAVDPKFARDWMTLGTLLMSSRQPDAAVEAFRKGIDADPTQPLPHKLLGMALMHVEKYDEAATAWQEYVKLAPDDVEGSEKLATTLIAVKRYADAAPVLESAIKIAPEQANLYMQLGSTYSYLQNADKTVANYKKALELDSSPFMYNDIGYQLAEANQELPLALDYAIKAVHGEEESSEAVKLSELKLEDLTQPTRLAAFWDTLGWVYYKMRTLDQAEKYLNAAWTLSQGKVEGEHLLEVRKQLHKASALPDSNQVRTTKLPRLVAGSASGEFFVVLIRDPKTGRARADEVKFVSGSEKLRSSDEALRSANFTFPFPDEGPTHILRRGILGCYSYTGCSFVLLDLKDVRSVN